MAFKDSARASQHHFYATDAFPATHTHTNTHSCTHVHPSLRVSLPALALGSRRMLLLFSQRHSFLCHQVHLCYHVFLSSGALDRTQDPLCSPVAEAGGRNPSAGTTRLSQDKVLSRWFLPQGLHQTSSEESSARGDCRGKLGLGKPAAGATWAGGFCVNL